MSFKKYLAAGIAASAFALPASAFTVAPADLTQYSNATSLVAQVQLAQEADWYLGVRGMLLPGKGLGIDGVEAGSPADLVGLKPGMVMTNCNGIDLVDEASLAEAIRISGGVLNMTLLSEDGTQVLQGTVQMTLIPSVSL